MEEVTRPLSRRRLLQLTAGGVGAMALARGLAVADGAHAALAAQRASTLKMWWWGQQEAVGIQKWMTDTLKKFQQQDGVKVSATLMDTNNVIPQFTNAAAAGHPPDVQFLFNGIYHMTTSTSPISTTASWSSRDTDFASAFASITRSSGGSSRGSPTAAREPNLSRARTRSASSPGSRDCRSEMRLPQAKQSSSLQAHRSRPH